MTRLAIVAVLLLSGCALFKRPAQIQSGGVTVIAPTDAGKPANLDTSKAGESLPLPAHSTIVITKFDPVAPILGASASLNVPAQPGRTETRIELAGPSTWNKTAETIKADTGTVDTSVALAKVAAAESRVLLYASIAAGALACLFVYLSYPTPAMACGVAAAVFFIAWKVAGVPDWLWALGAIAVAAGMFLWLGHRRGEQDAAPAKAPTS